MSRLDHHRRLLTCFVLGVALLGVLVALQLIDDTGGQRSGSGRSLERTAPVSESWRRRPG